VIDVIERPRKIARDDYRAEVRKLRLELQHAQHELRQANVAVVVLIGGLDRSGVSDLILKLNEWTDPRWVRTHAFAPPTEDERRRPPFWRYWRVLPARGSTAVWIGGWTMRAIADRLTGKIGAKRFERRLDAVVDLERILTDDGSLVLKFWLHRDKRSLERRLRQAEKNPKKAWRIRAGEWLVLEKYERAVKVVKRALERTGTDWAPWHVVDGGEPRGRDVAIARTILTSIAKRIEDGPPRTVRPPVSEANARSPSIRLASVNLAKTLEEDRYERQLERWQRKLHDTSAKALDKGVSSALVFEGWDAAGKGGVIRRLAAALDPADYRVYPVAAPTENELAHHYLWRFWGRLPPDGRIAIFDRSWYGRVLVERVEGFANEDEWLRAYDEINTFESMLCDHGIVLLKFWLHIDKDEQLRRFEDRQHTPFKKYKITDDDWRNRERWDDYEAAVDDMVARTSTAQAPWEIVPANDKRWARVRVIKAYCKALRNAL
jgi:polyphosphate:AMP phosphotransferase